MNKFPIPLDKRKIAAFCRKHHIIYFAFFGSILTDKFTKKSDVDVLVEFDRKYIPGLFGIAGMELELTDLIGRRVDLRTAGDLSRYFRDEVVAQAQWVYGKGRVRKVATHVRRSKQSPQLRKRKKKV
jgi:predicted nucleotidyltransferase